MHVRDQALTIRKFIFHIILKLVKMNPSKNMSSTIHVHVHVLYNESVLLIDAHAHTDTQF